MSKIKISELNVTELNALDHNETSSVVGGNTQVATISSSNGNSATNGGAALGVIVTQTSTSTNAIAQDISDDDVQVNVASILSRVGL